MQRANIIKFRMMVKGGGVAEDGGRWTVDGGRWTENREQRTVIRFEPCSRFWLGQ
ncbi:MAG TPA: hypothetical protein VHO70_20980 [Chitinispirillaceae bacterium]|nr:hypothetical protein [Chitinispirillaceae bacterium]